jgi:hypothetical protein
MRHIHGHHATGLDCSTCPKTKVNDSNQHIAYSYGANYTAQQSMLWLRKCICRATSLQRSVCIANRLLAKRGRKQR